MSGGWGGGWGNHVPETAKTVARAFYAGQKCRRGNCRTDGEDYVLEDTIIARRIPEDMIPLYVMRALSGKRMPHDRRPLEFQWGGWPTYMTARHLKALGVKAEVYHGEPHFNDVVVKLHTWYTPEEISLLERLPEPVPWLNPVRVRKERFVNLTGELFPHDPDPDPRANATVGLG